LVATDVTDHTTFGETNVFTYHGLYNGEPYPNNSANIRLTSWAVFYK